VLTRTMCVLLFVFFPLALHGKTVSYTFDIDAVSVNFTGSDVEALTIGGEIPAPLIRANVGDVLRVTFNNKLSTATSVHWHGILLPSDQDGVPFLNTRPISAGESFTFEFPVVQAGTYWYHSHTDLQIQRGVYGPIVLTDPDKTSGELQEEILLLSDWTDEKPDDVLGHLKVDGDYYAYTKDTVQSWDKVIANDKQAIGNRLSQSFARMEPMDLADVAYDAFLINGEKSGDITVKDPDAQQVLLRIINGSTSSYFDVEYAGGPMTLVAADGLDVEPIRVKRLRVSTAETYDVLVPVSPLHSYELRATSIDGSGYTGVYIGEGERVLAPDLPVPNLFLMGGDMPMPTGDAMSMTEHHMEASHVAEDDQSLIQHMTNYDKLRSLEPTSLPSSQSWRELFLSLTGNMQRYVWSFDGRTLREDSQILIAKGENVRLTLANNTMMNHPLHLHGHFFRVVNGQGDRSPLKHTVNVPPMGRVVIEFDANEDEDWLFHCHNQYHMKSGMTRVISYGQNSIFNQSMSDSIQPRLRWFSKSKLLPQSNFLNYDFSLADERHEFSFTVDSNGSGIYEAEVTYTYHFDRFFSGFFGLEKRKHERFDSQEVGIVGFNFTLPFLINSEWRVDENGKARIELQSDLQLSQRLGFDWRWNTDNEYRHRLKYRINERLSATVNDDSEYGSGVGVEWLLHLSF